MSIDQTSLKSLKSAEAEHNLSSQGEDTSSDNNRKLRILVLSTPFPSVADPYRGVFVKERVKAIAALGHEVRVISAIPWFPPIKKFSKWYRWSQYPREETFEGLKVYHPRYVLPPKVGGYFHPQLMYPAVKRIADQLRTEFHFDLIDSHFVYPNGVVATMLGQKYDVPVMLTGRGEDILRFPAMPFKGNTIRKALGKASHCIALSREIANAMQNNNADPEKITVIPNGVDTDIFHALPQDECRKELNLPVDAKIILSVGDRLELKGFHLLVEAMPEILKHHPEAYLVIVGGPGRYGRDYTPEIEQQIKKHDLQNHVLLAGPRPHDELPSWYNAADIFALLSSREGSPNVLLEALACGTPAVATPVGGIRDELEDSELGMLLTERSPHEAARVLRNAFEENWNRPRITEKMKQRSWPAIARNINRLFVSSLLKQ